MAIPTYEQIMLPLLKISGDKQEHSKRQAVEKLAVDFRLTPNDRRVLLPSGREELFANRVGWASTYLKKANLVEMTRWGYFKITDRGIELLKQNPQAEIIKLFIDVEANTRATKINTTPKYSR